MPFELIGHLLKCFVYLFLESGDASEVDKHVKFSAEPETDAGTSASLSTQG